MAQNTAADQCKQLYQQHAQALVRQDALRRELKTCEENSLALTNLIAGIELGKRAEAERVAAEEASAEK